MRDIRDDLKERLSLLHAERDDLQAQLKAKLAQIDAYEQQITGLLALEEARAIPSEGAPPALSNGQSEPATPAPSEPAEVEIGEDFEGDIMKILNDGSAREHSEIRVAMESEGWVADKKGQLGRQIQGVLLTLKNRGVVEYLGNSVWQKMPGEAEKAA